MKRFFISFTTTLIIFLLFIGGFVYLVDPFFHFHKPWLGMEAYMENAVYATPGAANHFEYDSVIVGSSMTENFRHSWFEEKGYNLLKLSYSGAQTKDYETILDMVFNSGNDIRLVIIDLNEFQLTAKPNSQYTEYPDYLYTNHWYTDVKYLYNYDVFWRSVGKVVGRMTNSEKTYDDSYTWETPELFSEENAYRDYNNFIETYEGFLRDGTYVRPERQELLDNCKMHMDQLTRFAGEHPDTQFIFYYPPYSKLYWEELKAQDTTEDMLAVYVLAKECLKGYNNILMFDFHNEDEIVNDLSIYRDVCHHSNDINYWIYQVIMDELVIDDNGSSNKQ